MTLVIAVLLTIATADSSALNLADLPVFQAALSENTSIPLTVGFQDLWGHPENFAGQRVKVVGHLERRFRQGPVGEFPALVESWISDSSKNLMCLVHPDRGEASPSGQVEFVGTFLRPIRYKASDAHRLVPLIIGAGPLVGLTPSDTTLSQNKENGIDRILFIVLGLLLIMMIARKSLNRPPAPRVVIDPTPEFIS